MRAGRELGRIDLGFGVWIRAHSGELAGLEDKTLLELNDVGSSIRVNVFDGKRSDMYVYRVSLDHVVDGDTIVVSVDCGLDIEIQQSLRLRAVNARPLAEPAGVKAKLGLEKILAGVDVFYIKTSRRDKYARFVADLVVPMRSSDSKDAFENGLYVNQELIDQGLVEQALLY